MTKLTPAQRDLLASLAWHGVGTTVTVVTSQYVDVALMRSARPEGQPIIFSTAAAVRGLLARGLIKGQTYFRSADVKLVDLYA